MGEKTFCYLRQIEASNERKKSQFESKNKEQMRDQYQYRVSVFHVRFENLTLFWATFYKVALLNIFNQLQGVGGVGCHAHIHSGFGCG